MRKFSKKIFFTIILLITMLLVTSNVFATGELMLRECDNKGFYGYILGAIRENRTTYTANKVKSIKIVKGTIIPEDVLDSWDVSIDNDGSVKAWIKANDTNINFYDLYIGAQDSIKLNSANYLFAYYPNCISITGLENLDTSNVTDMRNMFNGCNSLEMLEVKFNTSNVTDMSDMFNSCESLKELNFRELDTSNVVSMKGMFTACGSLINLDVSKFNTSNVTDMSYMFQRCFSLTSLDLSNFNTNKVTTMRAMFDSCTELSELNLTNLDTQNVTNMRSMFYDCRKLKNINVSNFNTKNVTAMGDMFINCSSLEYLDLSNFNTQSVSEMSQMFAYCENLETLDISGFNTDNVIDMSNMFAFTGLKKVIIRKSITDLNEIIKLSPEIALNKNAILYVPNITTKEIYEQDENYNNIFGTERIRVLDVSEDNKEKLDNEDMSNTELKKIENIDYLMKSEETKLSSWIVFMKIIGVIILVIALVILIFRCRNKNIKN